MKMNARLLLLLSVIWMSTSTHSFASVYFVAPGGSDMDPGSMASPYATIAKGVSVAQPGDTVFLRGGNYTVLSSINIHKSGTVDSYYYLLSYPGERAVLDCSSQAMGGSNRGILLTGSYWHIEGIDIKGAGDNGMKIDNGHHNRIVNCAFYRNRDSGLQMGNGASYNQVINCDSYYNADPPDYGDADGFAAKLDVGVENYFYGCRAWLNCDDGWDGYMRGADNASTIVVNCWAFENGYLEDGSDPGAAANGNGFKMGGSDDKTLRHDYTLKNCLAFKNKAKGFDQNSNMGSMILYNCTGYNNLGDNYKIYKELAAGEELILKNCLEYGGKVDLADFAIEEKNSWDGTFTVSDDDFLGLDESPAYGPRQADGSLPEIPYMHLSENSDLVDAGVDIGLPFFGIAPDLGCFERGFISNIKENEDPVLKIWPNPAPERININLETPVQGNIEISIYDMTGKLIKSSIFHHSGGYRNYIMDLPEAKDGIYLVRITGPDKKIVSRKILKKSGS